MMRYLKFSDEEGETVSAKDSLLQWLQHQTDGYPNITIKNLTSSFQDGLALCAIVHKFRPLSFDFASLSASSARDNVELGMQVAQQAFGMDRFVSVDEFFKLDDKSMLVYLSELYACIADTAKTDRAAKCIQKVHDFVATNDALRASYLSDGQALCLLLHEAEVLLADTAITGTMEGARAKLKRFNEYKMVTKRTILSQHFQLSSTHSQLAVRLAENGRPPFVPSSSSLEFAAIDKRIRALAEVRIQLRNGHIFLQLVFLHSIKTCLLTEDSCRL